MQTVNMHEAKTHLSKLVDRASKGQPFIIARAGKPLVKVVPLEPEAAKPPRRLGFLNGQLKADVDIKDAFKDEIEAMFYGEEIGSSSTRAFCCRPSIEQLSGRGG